MAISKSTIGNDKKMKRLYKESNFIGKQNLKKTLRDPIRHEGWETDENGINDENYTTKSFDQN